MRVHMCPHAYVCCVHTHVPCSVSAACVISFNVEGIHAYDIGTLLDKFGIAVRTGQHCAQPIMDHFGISGTVRVSFSFYNTKEEIDKLYKSLKQVLSMLS